MSVQVLRSPWAAHFKAFGLAIHDSALLVSPFITGFPLRSLAEQISKVGAPQVRIVTNLSANSLLQGSIDPASIAAFCRSVENVTVTHLPALHAKVYIADDTVAIVTSANLTNGGVAINYEYGVWLEGQEVVQPILVDLRAYETLGSVVTLIELDALAKDCRELQDYQRRVEESSEPILRQALWKKIEETHEALRKIRAKPGESTHAIFARTILYLLRRGPLTTQELHPLIQAMHPDLCDDSIDRVINDIHFGKRWKHLVRNAQQSLKDQDLIRLRTGRWQIAE